MADTTRILQEFSDDGELEYDNDLIVVHIKSNICA